MSIDDTIQRLKDVILDENCKQMNKSTVKGFYGELIVKRLLEKAGFQIEHFGNQAGYDLVINSNVKIDVKMSLLKDEFNWGTNYWGWALVHANKKKEITATHFVCLGCDTNLNPSVIVVVPANCVDKFPKGIRQFSKVKHGLVFFPNSDIPNLPDNRNKEKEFIENCNKSISSSDARILRLNHDKIDKNIFF